jgi:hypothetical protein
VVEKRVALATEAMAPAWILLGPEVSGAPGGY